MLNFLRDLWNNENLEFPTLSDCLFAENHSLILISSLLTVLNNMFTLLCSKNKSVSPANIVRTSTVEGLKKQPKTRSKLTGEHLTQKRDSNKVADMHLYWNHSSVWVLPPPVDSPHMPQNTPKLEQLQGVASDAFSTHASLILESYTLCDRIK